MVNPRFVWLPKGRRTDLGKRALDFLGRVGLELDEWQAYVLVESLRRRGGRFAATEIGLNVARQNGKGVILEARELVGLYLLRESLIIHSAHLFKTSAEHFLRLRGRIEDNPELSRELARGLKGGTGIIESHGQESIKLRGGRRLQFATRSKGAGRGQSCDCFIGDEAMFFSEMAHGAVFPTMSARPDPQFWYAGSAVDQTVHDNGVVFARVRDRGLKRNDPSLAYFEWSAGVDEDNPAAVPQEILDDPAVWAQANPALGIRLTREFTEKELRAMDPRTFAVERLGVGDWPRLDHISAVIDLAKWAELADDLSQALDPVMFAFDVSPDRMSSVSAAGRRADGLFHVECIASRRGTDWLPEYLSGRVRRNRTAAVVCDGYGPASSVIPKIEKLGLEVTTFDAAGYGQACGQFVDAVDEAAFRYPSSDQLTGAVKAAKTRPLGDAAVWSRKHSSANISPLVSATLALSAVITAAERQPMIVLPAA